MSDFIAHTSDDAPTVFDPNGFNKPIDVKFQGSDMFIVDFGIFVPEKPASGTGKVWVVLHTH
jgi:hypothetical protein